MQTIQFIKRGTLQSHTLQAPQQTLLQLLREDRHEIDCKEGCAEGDCGACVVALGRLENGHIQYRAANACIQFAASAQGAEVITAGDIGTPDNLHPVQLAMVECHAAQCGFCTPGFVMSLFTLYQSHHVAPSREEIHQALSGNLCRCTGYRPIIDAAQKMFEYPRVETPNHKALLHAMTFKSDAVFYPKSSEELAQNLVDNPTAQLVAGSTDAGLWVTKHQREFKQIIFTHNAADLKLIEIDSREIKIGAAVTLAQIQIPLLNEFPELHEWFARFASVPVRNMATLAGNVANGSPIGDSMPVLLALGAHLTLRKGAGSNTQRRTIKLEYFYLGYQKKDLASAEFIESIHIPRRSPDLALRVYKVSKRFDDDISAVCAAFAWSLENGVIKRFRAGYGGMAATPKRAFKTEAALIEEKWSVETARGVLGTCAEDFEPMSDHRASSAYRLKVAQNLLLRAAFETTTSNQTRVEYDMQEREV